MEGLGVDSRHILSREVILRPFQSYLSMLESGFWEVMLRISAQQASHELLHHCSSEQFTQQERREGAGSMSLAFSLFLLPRASQFFISACIAQ